MIGAIIGDMVGSPYEGSMINGVDDRNFPLFAKQYSRFTDDTVLTCATADVLLSKDLSKENFASKYKEWTNKYPGKGYGCSFMEWVEDENLYSNNSYGDGCMMRCSPIGIYLNDISIKMAAAENSIAYTHNCDESDRGTKSIVTAIDMAINGHDKERIKEIIQERFGHTLNMSVEDWRNYTKSSIRCDLIAPQALTCFMESTDFESTLKNAVYTKGDTDTVAAIAGSIAEAFYGINSISKEVIQEMKNRLPQEMIDLINNFYNQIDENSPYKGFTI